HLGGPPLLLRLRPYPTFRTHDSRPDGMEPRPVPVGLLGFQIQMQPSPEAPTLRMRMQGNCEPVFVGLPAMSRPLVYRVDRARGYEHVDQLTSPGYFEGTLRPGQSRGVAAEGWARRERDPGGVLALELEGERGLLARPDEAAGKRPAARFVLAA